MDTWSERFAALLDERQLTSREAGRLLGMSQTTVQALRGAGARPARGLYAHHALAISREFGVTIEWLVAGEMPRELSAKWPFTIPRAAMEELPILVRIFLNNMLTEAARIFRPVE